MISSQSVRGLLQINKDDVEKTLNYPGGGINIMGAIQDMVAVSISISDIYDMDFLKAREVDGLVDIVTKKIRDLTLEEIDKLIAALGSRLFLSFIERQLEERKANAWDKGVSHTLEVRRKIQGLFQLTDIITDDPMKGKLLGEIDG
jgi:hypothetical protein